MNHQLLTANEAAKFCRVSVKTIYDWKYKGLIPHCKLHGKLLFPSEALYAWVKSKYQCSTTSVDELGSKNQTISDPDPLLKSQAGDLPASAYKREALWQSKK